jgi:hypothetical protein
MVRQGQVIITERLALLRDPDQVLGRQLRRSRLFGQLPGKNKLKASSRLLVSPFPEIKIIPCCCGVL